MPAKLTMPTLGGLTNPKFRYVDRDHTNIAETFKRARRAMAKVKRDAETAQQALELEPVSPTVVTLPQRTGRRAA